MRGKVPKPRGCALVSFQAPQSQATAMSGCCRKRTRSSSAPKVAIIDGYSVSSTETTASPGVESPRSFMMSEMRRPVSLSTIPSGPVKRAAIPSSDSAMILARNAGSLKRSRIFATPPSWAQPGMIKAANAVCPARYG